MTEPVWKETRPLRCGCKHAAVCVKLSVQEVKIRSSKTTKKQTATNEAGLWF